VFINSILCLLTVDCVYLQYIVFIYSRLCLFKCWSKCCRYMWL